MKTSKIRDFLASLVGIRYRELPGMGPDLRRALEEALAEFHAEKCGEHGTPAFEVNIECFRIGRRKLRVSTEEEMLVTLWGPRKLVDQVYAKVVERWEARSRLAGQSGEPCSS